MKQICLLWFLALPFVYSLLSCSDDDDDITVSLTASNLTDKGYFDGLLYYNISSKSNKEATVSKAERSAVTIEIPERINIEGVTYRCTSIGSSAFAHCFHLIDIIIPSSVTKIGYLAFFDTGRSYSIHCKSSIPPKADYNWIKEQYENVILYVPNKAVSTYANTEPWCNFHTIHSE